MPARIPPQTPPPRGIQPPPNFKNISRSFAKSFPQKIVFAKPRPFFRTAHFLPFEPFRAFGPVGVVPPCFFSLRRMCLNTGGWGPRARHAGVPYEFLIK